MENPDKECPHRGWTSAMLLIAVLVAVSLIPPHRIGGTTLRRANILSDLVEFCDDVPGVAQAVLINEEDFEIDMERVEQRIATDRMAADTLPQRPCSEFEWNLENLGSGRLAPMHGWKEDADSLRRAAGFVPVECYDSTAAATFAGFCDTLLLARRPVRIAFLGDSFIEGDILTADLRELLQTHYGGGGTGFAPAASPLTTYRRSVKTDSKGWTSYNIMQRKTAPASLQKRFFVSGWVCKPADKASVRWEMTDFRSRIDSCTTAGIFFISPQDSRISVTLNDSLRQEFDIPGDTATVRQIKVRAPRIHTLSFQVLSGTEGFVGYGARFGGEGIEVDNYSIRSNNGQAMFWTDPSVNAQIDAMDPYDLVILQYGLNIMQDEVTDYSDYGAQMEKMIAYVRRCFPRAAVLVMGVSERSMRTDTGFAPMKSVSWMTACQREAARRSGTAFWPTADAMRALGGMEQFVKNGWAGKDYTHINYEGGRIVAGALFKAFEASISDARCAWKQQRTAELQEIVDSLPIDLIRQSIPEQPLDGLSLPTPRP